MPLGPQSISGFTIVSAGSLEEAEIMARSNPFISSIRVYEVMSTLVKLILFVTVVEVPAQGTPARR